MSSLFFILFALAIAAWVYLRYFLHPHPTDHKAFSGFHTLMQSITPEKIAREGLNTALKEQHATPSLTVYEVELYLFESERGDTVLPPDTYRQYRDKGLLTGADECEEVTLYMAASNPEEAESKAITYYAPLAFDTITIAVLTPATPYTPDPEWVEYHLPGFYGDDTVAVERNCHCQAANFESQGMLYRVDINITLTKPYRSNASDDDGPVTRDESVWVRSRQGEDPIHTAKAYLQGKYRDTLTVLSIVGVMVPQRSTT